MIFAGRLGLYILLTLLPALHPAVVQYTDLAFLLRALLMPLAAILAWIRPIAGRGRRNLHLTALGLAFISLPFLGFTMPLLELFLFVQYAYWSTWLMFRRRLARIFYADLFYFAFVIYRLLSLHSQEAEVFNVLALVLMFVGFISYAILLYCLEFGARRPRVGEIVISILLPLALGLSIALFLPENFAGELRIFNSLSNILEPPMRPLPDSAEGLNEDGNLAGNGRAGGAGSGGEGRDGDEGGDEPSVFLRSPDAWGNNRGEGGEGSSQGQDGQNGTGQNQYMVMVVNSPEDPLYLADEYFNHQDAERGFYSDPDFELNRLTRSQYLETWRNPDPVPLFNRRPVWIDVYSTIPEKLSSYDPYQIEPTIFDTTFYPISYTYRSESLVSNIGLSGVFPQVGDLLSPEKEELEPYLDLRIPQHFAQSYRELVDEIIGEDDDYLARIFAILQYYRGYQYELGFTDNVSTEAISSFLFETRSGDCTEFSNSAAILARLAGIPSRVVTGYLLSESLQTNAHRRAIAELQRHYPPIAEDNLSSLYLLTTAHRHSWAQFYLPIYGWVDFETTSFAIPPTGNMNPNNMDVIIPDLQERSPVQRRLPIPWGIVLRSMFMAIAVGIFIFYTLRWTRLTRLSLVSQRNNERGYKALYRLLIIRLHARGYELKNIDLTPAEYARGYPELEEFARLYTRLVFGEGGDSGALRAEYRRLLREGRRASALLREIFSLRDMRYL